MHATQEELDKQAQELLVQLEGKTLSAKDRAQIPLQEMPTQASEVRVKNMQEVALGYSESQVRVEAMRCLQCKTKPCIAGCPVH